MYLPVNAKKGNLGENSSVSIASLHRWESENQVTHTHHYMGAESWVAPPSFHPSYHGVTRQFNECSLQTMIEPHVYHIWFGLGDLDNHQQWEEERTDTHRQKLRSGGPYFFWWRAPTVPRITWCLFYTSEWRRQIYCIQLNREVG